MTEDHAQSAVRKASRRLIPFLVLCYAVNFLDRVNVGFAGLAMNDDLGFTPDVFGFGAGIFFVGYILFEIPSNLALARFGARIWIARIMISWGLVAIAMGFVAGETSFYVLRFALGVAEAGFFPGIILYLTYWFPREERARIVSLFMTAVPLATVIGGPVSGVLLGLHGVAGLAGWRWLFIIEGIPAVLLGIFALRFLTDRPRMPTGFRRRSVALSSEGSTRRRKRRGPTATPGSGRPSPIRASSSLGCFISASWSGSMASVFGCPRCSRPSACRTFRSVSSPLFPIPLPRSAW